MRPVSSRFFAKFLVLQARLSLSLSLLVRVREREEEERKTVCSSHPSFLPPFPSFSFFLSSSGSLLSSRSCLLPSLSFSLVASSRVLHGVIAHGTLSSVSLIFLLSLGGGASSLWFTFFSVVRAFPFRPLILPRVVFHPTSRQSISPPRGHRPHQPSSSPSSFFVPVDR